MRQRKASERGSKGKVDRDEAWDNDNGDSMKRVSVRQPEQVPHSEKQIQTFVFLLLVNLPNKIKCTISLLTWNLPLLIKELQYENRGCLFFFFH